MPSGVGDLGQHWFRKEHQGITWRHQTITWTNVDSQNIDPPIVFEIHTFENTTTLPREQCVKQRGWLINTLRPRQNERHFADDIFKCIFLNENVSIAMKISPKFAPKGQINNIPALFKIMAWRRPGDKPLSEPIIVIPTHICVTRPQWVKKPSSTDNDVTFIYVIKNLFEKLFW